MPKVTYTTLKGLVQGAGQGVQLEDLPFSPVQTLTANSGSIPQPGVFVTTAAVTASIMPLASSVPGAYFVFRNGNVNQALSLTGSLESNGTQVFRQSAQTGKGSGITLAANILNSGDSVTMFCDGSRFIVVGVSGTVSYTGA